MYQSKPLKKKFNGGRELLIYALCLIVPFGLIWGANALFVANHVIPSGSMEPTLMVGDRILGLKPQQKFVAERGQVVIFTDDLNWTGVPTSHVIKRVIGIPGDVVECCDNGQVVVNGEPVEESYVQGSNAAFPAQTVPVGKVFVMGDNRENSADSRYHLSDGTQFVSQESVTSVLWLRYWPLDQFTVF